MSNAALGSIFVAVGLCVAVLGVVVSAFAITGRHIRWGYRYVATALAVSAVGAVAVMERALITRDFTVKFVAENGSSTTPPVFNIATLWAALEGSILLWVLVLCGYVLAAAVNFRSKETDPLFCYAMLVMFAVCAFFFALMNGPADPFIDVSPPAGYDGPGPNPLLQNHILMAFHPPILYLGYVGFTVPCAFAVAALATGRLDKNWLTSTRRWTLVAWGFLTLGIVLGAWWSYETLGWGGYWAWDPVENASFLPWLTGTAYLHSVVAQERKGILRVWNLSLVIATFSLTILGTFLTRSGVLASVHAFTESNIGPAILALFAVTVTVSLALIAWRGDQLKSDVHITSPISREGTFLANNALFAAFAFVVLLGTVFPLLIEAFDGREVSVGSPYFERLTAPIGFALLLLMAISPVLPWSGVQRLATYQTHTARPPLSLTRLLPSLQKRLTVPMWIAAVTLAAAVVGGARGWAPLLAFGLGSFAAGTAIRQIVLAVRRYKIWGFTGRKNGGMVVHIGVVLIAVAFAASQSYARQAEFDMSIGDIAYFAGHEIIYKGSAVVEYENRTERVAYVQVDNGKVYNPAIALYPFASQTIGIPSVRSSFLDDVSLSILLFPDTPPADTPSANTPPLDTPTSITPPLDTPNTDTSPADTSTSADNPPADGSTSTADRVILRVTVQPMIVWLWIGGIVMALGTVLSLIPNKSPHNKSARDSSPHDKPAHSGKPAHDKTELVSAH